MINLINCIIADNTCGIYNYGGICNSYNNLITNNLTGGTISISGASSVIINNTIINNQSTAIGNYSGSYVNVANSIIWDNSQSFDANYFVYVCNSLIQGSELPELINNIGGNILDTDPLFDDPLNGNFELQSDSPAIDAGSFYATNLDSIDLVGNSRISNGRVDIGAYEYQQTGDWLWVTSPLGGEFIESSSSFLITWIRSDTSSTVTIEFFDGADWSTISNSAVNTGEYNDWIAPGIDSDDCLIRITDNGNNEITNVSDNTFSIKGNIIEHNEEVSGIWTLDDSPYTIIGKATIPAGSTLSIEPGVEVEFKTGSMNTVSSDYFDKGMLQVNGKLEAVGSSESPITFSRNGEDGYWGMIYFTSTADTTSILSHCNIEYADALITSDIFFGGISFNNSSAIVENCDISNCYYGIDISYSSEPIIRNNKIHYNIYGGILCWSSSNTEIIGNAIYNNGYIANETYGGIGIRCYSSSPPLINNTISLSVSERRLDRTRIEVNAGEYEKSLNLSTRNLLYGIYCEESSSPYITNSLVYGNGPFEEGANIYIESGSPHLSYCLLEDQTFPPGAIDEGNNVLGANPFFVDAANENFQLRYISPCINAGIPDTTGLNLPEYDLNGNPRVFAGENAIIDIGAYEYQGEPLQIDFSADITSGNAPLIVEFTVTANYPADVYEWDFDNDEVIDAAGESVSWEFPVGVYTVTLNAIYGLDVIIIEKENYITSLNSPPFVENPVTAVSFDEDMIDSNLDLNYIFSDENGDSLSFYNSGNDSIMVEIEDGIVILSGGLNWYGTEVITFTADDGYIERGNDLISEKQNQDYSRSTRNIFSKANESISGRVAASLDIEITIEPVNDPPEIDLPESITFFEDESLNFDLTSYVDDVDLDLLTIAAVEFEGDSLSAIYEDLQVVFSAVANWYGLTEVAVTITDNVSRITATDIFTVEVIAVNDDPEIDLPDSFTFLEDESLVVDFSEFVDDVDNVDLVLSCAGNLEIGVEIDSLIVTFTATENWFGSELLTFTVDDQQGRAVAFDSVEVIVTPINDAPEIELPESFSFNEDESLVVDFAPYINDIDGDELIIVSENYVHVIVNIEEHIVTFTASENWYGVETIIFTVYDTEARLSANDIVNVIVEPENDPPTIDLPDNFTFLEDESLVVDFGEFVNDVDDVDLLLSCAGNLYINVDIDSLIVTFTAMENWNGSELLTFTIDDQQGREIATDEVDIVVEAVMYPPLINLPCSFTLEEDTELYVNFAFFILGGDEFELTADAHENIDIEINGFGVTFTPSTNWNGSEIITFTINDNQSRTTASDETIVIVTPINDTPEINLPDNFSFDEGSSLTVDFHQFVYDADGDSLLIINEPAENIWVETIDLEVTFSAEPGWTGSEYVFFMVDDAICRPEYMDSTLVIVNELWGHHYGDIDDNGSVEAYDAALILQYVVGIDPEPAAPLPWEDWQITAADVSGNLEIGAYDASLVIQYFVGLIYAFPVETFREEIVCQKADISVTLEDGILRFTSNSELYSLYLTLDEEIENYKCQENIISASNENRIALAAAYPITGEFLSIPVKLNYQQIKLIANEQYYEIELGDNIEMVNNLTVYPNPFNPEINISFELEESGYILLEVYNIKGQRVCTLISNEFTAGKHLVTWNASEQSSGIYLLQYQSENIMETRKIILLK
ncbi:MAG: tandem-95 repeat protein [Candidatus Stygibacter australis]|nr:tandem-95 repeat protein [Candidatus Stygibacter australis]